MIQEEEEQAEQKMTQLKQEHQEKIDALTKERDKLNKQLADMEKSNKTEENAMRARYVTRQNELVTNVTTYDGEIQTAEETKAKMETDYKDSAHDLQMFKDEYELLREEARKREEIAAILAAKEAEFTEKMRKLEQASEYIQAHWQGMLARKERDKAMKGKKKKKKKK